MVSSKQKILTVDDDKEFLEYISDYLSEQGFEVYSATDGGAMRELLAEHTFDLVLLDLAMPDEDGISLTKFLRESSDVGIIILSGKGSTVDRILGIELGADDYIGKPFEPRELLARIRSVLRRVTIKGGAAPAKSARFAGIFVDLRSRTLLDADGDTIPTTPSEFALLEAFITHANTALGREELISLIKGPDIAAHDRLIDVLVFRLRRKIEERPDDPQYIKTIHGKGYMLCTDVVLET